jgi:hypothetical protein
MVVSSASHILLENVVLLNDPAITITLFHFPSNLIGLQFLSNNSILRRNPSSYTLRLSNMQLFLLSAVLATAAQSWLALAKPTGLLHERAPQPSPSSNPSVASTCDVSKAQMPQGTIPQTQSTIPLC